MKPAGSSSTFSPRASLPQPQVRPWPWPSSLVMVWPWFLALGLACVAMQASTVWPCRSLLCGHAGLSHVALQVSPVWPCRPFLPLCGHAGPSSPPVPHIPSPIPPIPHGPSQQGDSNLGWVGGHQWGPSWRDRPPPPAARPQGVLAGPGTPRDPKSHLFATKWVAIPPFGTWRP